MEKCDTIKCLMKKGHTQESAPYHKALEVRLCGRLVCDTHASLYILCRGPLCTVFAFCTIYSMVWFTDNIPSAFIKSWKPIHSVKIYDSFKISDSFTIFCIKIYDNIRIICDPCNHKEKLPNEDLQLSEHNQNLINSNILPKIYLIWQYINKIHSS